MKLVSHRGARLARLPLLRGHLLSGHGVEQLAAVGELHVEALRVLYVYVGCGSACRVICVYAVNVGVSRGDGVFRGRLCCVWAVASGLCLYIHLISRDMA